MNDNHLGSLSADLYGTITTLEDWSHWLDDRHVDDLKTLMLIEDITRSILTLVNHITRQDNP